MSKDYSKEIADAISMFLHEDDWKFSEVDDGGVIRTGVKLNSKIKNADVYINVLKESFVVLSVPKLGADKNCMDEMAEFITRANYGLNHGNFEMDYSDGEIRYKTSLYCGDVVPTYEQIKAAIYINISTLDDYGNGIAMVAFGMGTPEEAVESCENN
ncbi:MAG: YbjN domain-containing protein [Ruminococcus sp.]|nr:YbjN domain-containing protein [Ruminococcus sp.]MDE7226277.1 YbjN domain-containing protein [Ruminococcus sp.]